MKTNQELVIRSQVAIERFVRESEGIRARTCIGAAYDPGYGYLTCRRDHTVDPEHMTWQQYCAVCQGERERDGE